MYTRGFTMFFATLVASLALAIGLAMYDLTVRELELSTVTAQSQYAIYAADTGAECVLYWDTHYNCRALADGQRSCSSAFATSSHSVAPSTVLCASQNPVFASVTGDTFATTTFNFAILQQTYNSANIRPCVALEVGKAVDASGVVHTTILSHGYNTCNSGASQLERELQLNY